MERDRVLELIEILRSDTAPDEAKVAAADQLWAQFEHIPPDLIADVAVLLADEAPTETVRAD